MNGAIREFLCRTTRRITSVDPRMTRVGEKLLADGAQEIGEHAVARGFDAGVVLDER